MSDTAPVLHEMDEVAELLHMHRKSVEAIIKRGELGVVRIGRRVFVRDDQLAAFIDSNTVDVD